MEWTGSEGKGREERGKGKEGGGGEAGGTKGFLGKIKFYAQTNIYVWVEKYVVVQSFRFSKKLLNKCQIYSLN